MNREVLFQKTLGKNDDTMVKSDFLRKKKFGYYDDIMAPKRRHISIKK